MEEFAGWITIGTKMDTKQMERDLKRAESDLKKFEKQMSQLTEKEAKIKAKVEIDEQDYKQKLKQLNQKKRSEYQANEKFGVIQNQDQIDLKYTQLKQTLDAQYAKTLDKNDATLEEIHKKMQENTREQERLNNKIQETSTELNKVKGISDFKGTIDNIGKSIQRTTKNVVRWGLAIFGVRSAYLFVRQAMSTLSQYNEDLATNLQYIRFALATAIEPLVIKIVEWAYKLLSIVFTIIKLLTGYDLFKNTGVDKYEEAMQKGSKSLASGAKSAKEIHKQLAGFDEMNVLSDNSASGGASAGTGVNLPTLELKEIELPQWMKDLLTYGEELLALIIGIAGAIKLLSLGLEPLKALGIGVALAGIVYAVEGLIKYLQDPTWANFGQIIEGIGIAVIGLGIAFFSALGWPVIIAGIITVIIGMLIKHWEEIKALFDKAVNWLTKKMEEVKEKYGFFAGLIIQGIRNEVQLIRDTLNTIFIKAKEVLDNIISFFKNVFAGNWKNAWQNLVNITRNMFDIVLSIINIGVGTIKNLFITSFGIIGDIIGGIIKGAVNMALSFVESKLNGAIGMINSALSIINAIPGVNISKIGKLTFPRLAQGGIVNNPGKGVMMGSYIAGENGPEAVLPLTDGTLQKLANMMPITVHVTNTMNGRIISREIQRIQNQSDFAMNR